eukprot:9941576-Lingulodinium_polyedra.AAC.1
MPMSVSATPLLSPSRDDVVMVLMAPLRLASRYASRPSNMRANVMNRNWFNCKCRLNGLEQ